MGVSDFDEMHLFYILESVCTKFEDFCSDSKNFMRKNRFGLYERLAVGVSDFDETSHAPFCILESVCTKCEDFCSDSKNCIRKNRFGLYGRWAVGVADFDEINFFFLF